MQTGARPGGPAGIVRRLPVGAEPQPAGGVHFRVWAPRVREIAVEIDGGAARSRSGRGGRLFLRAWSPSASRHALRFRTDTLDRLLPDPASRFQPEGPHGPSEIVDPGAFRWTDQDWRGRPREEMVIYEMHVGTFTPEGTWEAAARELPELAAARHHLHRADAGRRFRRTLRLGL